MILKYNISKISILLFLITSYTLSAQSYNEISSCATEESNQPDPPGTYSYSTDPTRMMNNEA